MMTKRDPGDLASERAPTAPWIIQSDTLSEWIV
jgi:hypothetical protein